MHTRLRHFLQHLHHGHHPIGRRGHHHHHHGGDFHDSEAMTRGRKFQGKDLQLMFLALLKESPRHGYELIKEIDLRSNGYYVPSPGVVYPTLTLLEEMGLVSAEAQGSRKKYQLTEEGRHHLQQEQEQAEFILAGLKHMGMRMQAMRRAMAGEAPDADESGWTAEYIAAHRSLKRALIMKADAEPAEQQRIAAILLRAVAEITQGGAHD